MSSRHQSRRRRSYGRREHEVRERRQREEVARVSVGAARWSDDAHEMEPLAVVRGVGSVVSIVPPALLARETHPALRATIGGTAAPRPTGNEDGRLGAA